MSECVCVCVCVFMCVQMPSVPFFLDVSSLIELVVDP